MYYCLWLVCTCLCRVVVIRSVPHAFIIAAVPKYWAINRYHISHSFCMLPRAPKQGGVKTKRLAQLIAPLQNASLATVGLGAGFGLVKLRDLKAGGVNNGVGVALKVRGIYPQAWVCCASDYWLVLGEATEPCSQIGSYSSTVLSAQYRA